MRIPMHSSGKTVNMSTDCLTDGQIVHMPVGCSMDWLMLERKRTSNARLIGDIKYKTAWANKILAHAQVQDWKINHGQDSGKTSSWSLLVSINNESWKPKPLSLDSLRWQIQPIPESITMDCLRHPVQDCLNQQDSGTCSNPILKNQAWTRFWQDIKLEFARVNK